ncbi:MAG: HesA/MoeB/ThiF family protein [Minisyncoccales bacterium]
MKRRAGRPEIVAEIMPRVIAQIEKRREKRMEIYERNWGLISSETQEKIKQARVLLVGCGLGSQIAVLASRTGFCHFELWDGDKVEVHNLNRQVFNQLDVGFNKAEVTAKKIQEINIEAETEVYPQFLRRQEDISAAVERNDFIVNMADPNQAMWLISEAARKHDKIEFHPLNCGWIAYCLILTPQTPSLIEIFEGKKIYGFEFYEMLINKTLKGIPDNSALKEFLKKYGEEIRSGKLSFPQLGTTTYLTTAIVVETIIKILAGAEVILAPQPVICYAL